MTALAEGVDVDLEQLVASDIVCEVSDCSRSARWRMTVRCPFRHTWLICDDHRRRSLEYARRLAARSEVPACARCAARGRRETLPFPPAAWRPL